MPVQIDLVFVVQIKQVYLIKTSDVCFPSHHAFLEHHFSVLKMLFSLIQFFSFFHMS